MRRADSLAERAAAAGDRVAELCGRFKEGLVRLSLEPEGAAEAGGARGAGAAGIPVADDHMALYIAYDALV